MGWSVKKGNENVAKELHLAATDNTATRSMPERKREGFEHLFQEFSQEEWDSYPFAKPEDMQWFREAKYGLFFHVGLSALGKVDIGWSKQTHKLPDTGIGPIPDEIYDGWAQQIELKDFDAREWIDLAKKGGMKYVVIITKHHDGFHMWDTAFSDHKITNAPFGRDYIKELVDACHEAKMKVGLYYSQRDWHQPYYEPLEKSVFEKFGEHPPYKVNPSDPFIVTEKHKKYIEYLHNTVLELMKNYGEIDLLWWDALWWGGMFYEEMWKTLEIEKKVRELQPHIIINNRGSVPGDFDTPECTIGYFQNDRSWESCMPLGEAWAWTGNEVKSQKRVISDLIRCTCGDGNYLLSIGAMPSGAFDEPEKERILAVGKWLEQYGQSVYATHGGPWLPTESYGSVYTQNKIYIHVLDEKIETISLPKLDNTILKAACLTGEKVALLETKNGYRIQLELGNDIDRIIELTLKEDVQF